ncbi:signal transduction histidine kinase [Desulfovibrio sp. X2]|uniref:histidine kinase dimerization/phosphoacceptor domain -containing protein n=1 Tax=Desulfovibrio sp. X2 TaxID=941449 RepID=UPI000358D82E|nr:histidine kinase dimerization/phosphoacceptor domain -containing protein [Desulfovibrio sp. X2]EPR44670.1 signal transduction histidine kinase [Desulfovibrio sp. X2]
MSARDLSQGTGSATRVGRIVGSLRFRLLLIIVCGLVPIVLVTLSARREMRISAENDVLHEAERLADSVAFAEHQFVEGVEQFLITLSRTPQVADKEANACSLLFAEMRERYPRYSAIRLLSPSGHTVCASSAEPRANDVSERAWFREVMRTGRFTSSEYRLDPATGRAEINFALPLTDDAGSVSGILAVSASLDGILAVIGRISLPPDSSLTLLTPDGTILARHPDGTALVGQNIADTKLFSGIRNVAGRGAFVAQGLAAGRYLFACSPLKIGASSLDVCIGRPEEQAFAAMGARLTRYNLLLCLVALLSMAVIFVGGEVFVFRQVSALMAAVRRLGGGDLTARTNLPPGQGEIHRLARAFDEMAERLAEEIRERRLAEEGLRLHTERLEMVNSIASANLFELTLQEFLDHVLRRIADFAPGMRASYSVVDKDGTRSVIACSAPEGMAPLAGGSFDLNAAPDYLALLRQNDVVAVSDVAASPPLRPFAHEFAAQGTVALLDVPVRHDEGLHGLLSLNAPVEREWTERERAVLSGVAEFLSVAVPALLARDDRAQARREQALLFTLSPDLLCIVDTDARLRQINPAWGKALGYEAEELLGRGWRDTVMDEDAFLASSATAKVLRGIPVFQVEVRHSCKDGTTRWIAWSAQPLLDAGMIFCIGRDMTERRAYEEQLRRSLEEKDILLREIHHRVKNNLQIISSLLNLQSGGIDDPGLQEIFAESRNRITTLALVHESIYRSHDLARVDFAAYLKNLASRLVASFQRGSRISLAVDAQALSLPMDKAIPCGLILNELITNAVRHAFVGRAGGSLRLRMRREQEQIVLSVSDDGVGMPEVADISEAKSLGLMLVRGLVEQLKGDVSIEPGQDEAGEKSGTRVTLSFPAAGAELLAAE